MGRKAKNNVPKKICTSCNKEKQTKYFYNTNNSLFSDGKSPICKDCTLEQVDPYDVESVINMLKFFDRPFLEDRWLYFLDRYGGNAFGHYLRECSSLNRDLSFKNSSYSKDVKSKINNLGSNNNNDNDDSNFESQLEQIKDDVGQEIKYSKDLQIKWGSEYTKEEILKMEKFYQEMLMYYEVTTPQHKDMLKKACKYSLLAEREADAGNLDMARKCNEQYLKLIDDGGFKPSDKKQEDDSSGIRTFSRIFEEVEKRGHIDTAPVDENQDIVDKTIQFLINYQLKLLNMGKLTDPPPDTPKVEEQDEQEINQYEREYEAE